MSWFIVYASIGWVIRLMMIPVVLRREFAPGASLAWLGIVFLHPYIGVGLYVLLGESRLGPRRAERHREIVQRFRDPERHADRQNYTVPPDLRPTYQPMVLQAQRISGLPALAGNRVEFFPDAGQFTDRLVGEIEAAQSHVHLLYYIFACDAPARRVVDALLGAARRGVKCRVLADAVASRVFFGRRGLAKTLVNGGVQVAAALPVALIRRRLARMDLRNHRKLAIIDGQAAYVGSHNLIDPSYGGRRGGPWFDLTTRLAGPIVSELALVFAEDWFFETNQELELPLPQSLDPAGELAVQAVPTGPTGPGETYRRLLLAAIQCSRRQLTITTPYFVPDEAAVLALMMAADRGVDVSLILPQRPDHFLTSSAGRAHFQALLNADVAIYLFRPGLLHAKTATVDDAFTLMGSANLDVRSFNLNFELSVLLYGPQVTKQVRDIQHHYLSQSDRIDAARWAQRPIVTQYTDRAISLLSPLL
ncbi:MAG: cardiolipin synthase [Tepidisphaeraceae bacterium]|jgi:cardiolipin synthase